ncbi:DUF418 domain-containing protein [Kangiella koreensis]|uniref:DUF418 domain-containing protein n=1 Tax=Kangiella koreensis (strain DSM 16069 / JCM 12317 / KCTC 12182 / SW-125) TaxID=523791 RepID=C7R8T1_KANKD|nr:DUF418 domain-containing protein [Kangiella koreensis]ACV25944.1 protein of unknown function DUF418 [Kangiella koreensis DSM 16069]
MFLTSNGRIASLDLMRGVVILMILIININYFSTPSLLRYNPLAFAEFSSIDKWVWFFEYAFVKQRFMTMLAILYGAGIVLFTNKYLKQGVSPTKPFILRSLLLIIFGLMHAYLIWDGDILVAYAVCGLIVYWLRNLKPILLISIGFILAFGATAPDMYASVLAIFNPPETSPYWFADTEAQQQMLTAYQGSWWQLTPGRIEAAFDRQTWDFLYFTLWRCSGLMMIGMGLIKTGFFSGERNHKAIMGWCLLIGIPVSAATAWFYIESGFSYQFFMSYLSISFYIGSLVLAIGYLCLFIVWSQSNLARSLQDLMAQVGRMAFTLYIMQSIICSFIFYGYGLDMYGKVSRSELALVTVAIWAVQILFVKLWFSYFKQGPLEALWRKGYSWGQR